MRADFFQGAKLLSSYDPMFSLLWDVEELYEEVMLPFNLYMPQGKWFDKVKRMIDEVEEIDTMFIYDLSLFLFIVGCPVFEYKDIGEWTKILQEYKAKEKELRLICGGKE